MSSFRQFMKLNYTAIPAGRSLEGQQTMFRPMPNNVPLFIPVMCELETPFKETRAQTFGLESNNLKL